MKEYLNTDKNRHLSKGVPQDDEVFHTQSLTHDLVFVFQVTAPLNFLAAKMKKSLEYTVKDCLA